MSGAVGVGRGTLVGAAAAVLVLAAGSTLALAAGTGGFSSGPAAGSPAAGGPGRFGARGTGTTASGECTVPALPGAVVDVELIDMGRMGAMMGEGNWRSYHSGMMRLTVSPGDVPAGVVSFQVENVGTRTHEMVVLPLRSGAQVGSRVVGADGTVDETGSLGEASASCAAGAGDGITAGSVGWVTLHLPAGRYELLCNIPGHYPAGMYAELDVG